MSTVTTKLGLTKPVGIEQFNLATYNNNLDLVDANAITDAKAALGLMWYKSNPGDTGAIGATQTVIDACPSFTFKGGRKYKVGWRSEYSVTNVDTHGEVCINSALTTDAVGLITGLTRYNRHTIHPSTTLSTFFEHAFTHTPSVDSTVQVKFTLQQVAGTGTLALTGSAVARPLEFYIEDLGAQF